MATNNIIILIGNLGTQPETIVTANGEHVTLSIATTDSYKDKSSGQWKRKKPIWHRVQAFGPAVKTHMSRYQVGDRVKITGSLVHRTREVETNGERKRFTHSHIIATRIEAAPLPKKGA